MMKLDYLYIKSYLGRKNKIKSINKNFNEI